MDKAYDHKKAEKNLYEIWEKKGYFKPKIDHKKKPFTILIPPPNASGRMHTGNVLMIAIEDLLIRWHRMKGDPTLWVPGTDHAGTETQITFEKQLQKQGKSRFNYTRKELYNEIWNFVQDNKGNIESQMRQMGASVDWSRYTFTLDEKVIKTVHNTFKKMHTDGLIYRSEYMVNYCSKCGTTYSDVEIKHEERNDPLYYIQYKFVDNNDSITVATVRPETVIFDTHLAVHPKGKSTYLADEDRRVINPLNGQEMRFLKDDFVDPEFGTGIVKLTPAIDKNDYDVFRRHTDPNDPASIQLIEVLNWDGSGKMSEKSAYGGLSVHHARKKAVFDLEAKEAIVKVDEKYVHNVAFCKAGHQIEPLVIPNWFIKTDDAKLSLKKPALDAVKEGKVKIYPQWQEIKYIRWMEEMRDWPVSRQNVWGIQIPVWYEITDPNEFYVWYLNKKGEYTHGILGTLFEKGVKFEEISSGLQRVVARPSVKWVFEEGKEKGKDYLPETDTFDTWFSSGQWPLVTLGYPDSEDFKYFYPTAVMETGWEIIRLWVSRMVMFGYYLAGQPPFTDVYLHGMVRAIDGRKMSKSLGNVINPEEYMEQYGVDSLRMGLIAGTANGKDFNFPKDRVIAFKHFGNKIWNMGRFLLMMREQWEKPITIFAELDTKKLTKEDTEILKQYEAVVSKVDGELEKFRFADAADAIYHFMWHEIADKYIEHVKSREDKDIALSVLTHIYISSLKLLHPFMPFITEAIYQQMPGHGESIMIESYPVSHETKASSSTK